MVGEINLADMLVSFLSQGCVPYNTDSVTRRFGKVFKQLVKFFVALLLYCLANVALAMVFNSVKLCPVVIFEMINQSLRMFLAQVFSLLGYILSNYGVYTALTLACIVEVSFVFFVWGGFVVMTILAGRIFQGNDKRVTSTSVQVCCYVQHIQFLS